MRKPLPNPSHPGRRRLTQAEWDAELARAKAAGQWVEGQAWTDPLPLRSRTGRRRSWWQRGWKR